MDAPALPVQDRLDASAVWSMGNLLGMVLESSGLGLALDAVGLADAGRVGRKAATLGELKRAEFPVPEGMVLTTEALARTLAAAGLGGDAQPEQVLAVGLPAEVAEAMAAAAERLGGGLLAVRSSGVDEDLAGASYAGQYESVLDVPAQRLADAVRRCWASAFTDHVVAYRRAHEGGPGAAMAVLVLPMVAAEAAGVERLDENLGAASLELTGDDLDEIEGAAAQIQVQGARYPEHLQRLIDR